MRIVRKQKTEEEKEEFGLILAYYLSNLILENFEDVDVKFVSDKNPKQNYDVEDVEIFVNSFAWQKAYDLSVEAMGCRAMKF